ncbi:unnamed protein product [Ectocarpus sp. 12 AP-2014]
MRPLAGSAPLLLVLGLLKCAVCRDDAMITGGHWKEYLTSEKGNAWFEPWNHVMQAKLDVLAAIVEDEQESSSSTSSEKPFRVLMVGDSTMSHQYGAICGFMGEREGRRYDPEEAQHGSPGCCMDTLPKEDEGEGGGGRGLCFEFDQFRFLDPKRAARTSVDAYYFGSGLHLLHMYPRWPDMHPMEPLRVQSWLNYESLLEGVVQAVRYKSGPNVKVVFMTNHAIADERFHGEYKDIRAAYREGPGNATIRAECQDQNNTQVKQAASVEDAHGDYSYSDWRGTPDIAEYMIYPEGQGLFTVDTYCEEAILDRRGSLQLSRRARPVMSRLGVPLVDAARIVEGQGWASNPSDGRHFHKIVPIEVVDLLSVLGAPPAPPSLTGRDPAEFTVEARERSRLAHSSATRRPGAHACWVKPYFLAPLLVLYSMLVSWAVVGALL